MSPEEADRVCQYVNEMVASGQMPWLVLPFFWRLLRDCGLRNTTWITISRAELAANNASRQVAARYLRILASFHILVSGKQGRYSRYRLRTYAEIIAARAGP